MKNRVVFILKYYLFWIIYFSFGRLIFVIYNNQKIESFLEITKSFVYGPYLDLSISSYIMLVIGIILGFSFFISEKIIYKIIKYLSLTLLTLTTFLIILDIELYRNWGFRIDDTIFIYLKEPEEALASSNIFLLFILILGVLTYISISYFFIKRIIEKIKSFGKERRFYFIFFLIFSILMIIPIRGGIGLSPINIGSVYYSKNQFCNHSAINPIWNFLKTIIDGDNKKENIKFYPEKKATDIFNKMKEEYEIKESKRLLNIDKPNIIIIIMESFSFNCLEKLGGKKDITPNLDKLIEEGILFENCVANGNRTDRGIVSILSGYHTQGKNSIINNVKKVEKLNNIGLELKKIGYNNSFYYGGDINFVNMKSYFTIGGYDKIITDKNFKKENQNSWGAYDEYVFEKMYEDIKTETLPFFKVLLTITSHEPFTTPNNFERIFKDNNEENKYLNTINYSDKSIGDFINKLKKEKIYDSTLLILVSDHGHKFPNNKEINSLEFFRIPMIWLGGALKEKGIVLKEYINQSDIVLLLGDQLSQNWESRFPFSKNIFKNKENYINFSFNNGIGFFSKEDGFIWDINSNSFLHSPKNTETEEKGKAFFQILMEDYERK